jgi:hypothetical protein
MGKKNRRKLAKKALPAFIMPLPVSLPSVTVIKKIRNFRSLERMLRNYPRVCGHPIKKP